MLRPDRVVRWQHNSWPGRHIQKERRWTKPIAPTAARHSCLYRERAKGICLLLAKRLKRRAARQGSR
eukprot:scaffold206613_cov26-Tisochrysis_lutea.AAC.5